ncbi:MAG: rod shape-determining protein RodA [Spirochaetaceae bacterium]
MKSRSLFSVDVYILAATVILVVIGVLFIYSSGINSTGELVSREYLRQIVWAATGLLVLGGFSYVDYERLYGIALLLFAVALLLLVITLLFGRVVNGARSWIGIGGLGIQPSEYAKIATIVVLAKLAQDKRLENLGGFILGLGIALIPTFLVLAQPDLGTAMVYIPIYLGIAYFNGAKMRHIMFVILSAGFLALFTVLPAWEQYIVGEPIPTMALLTERRLLGALVLATATIGVIGLVGNLFWKRRLFYWVGYAALILVIGLGGAYGAREMVQDYQIMRLIVFMDPYVDPRGAGWNIIQSVTAVGSGGAFGKGFLQGTQSHYQYLPQQSTDFIFSILAEEWGFLGAVTIFALFLVILGRGLYILSQAKDRFAVSVAGGIVSLLFFHFIINVGMTIGVMPITGIPLFFLSYGGSSLWTGMMAVGILMSIYSHRYTYTG